MYIIDRYAYSNALRPIDPAQKSGLAMVTILLCLLLNRPSVGFPAFVWMSVLTVWWARIPFPVFGRILLAEGAFLVLSVAGVAISIGLHAPELPYTLSIGAFWLGTSPEALTESLRLLTRALGCAAALNFLILTTPLIDTIELLRRLRIPDTLIEVMTIVYRAIFVLLESMQRIHTAQDARLGYQTPQRAMQSVAMLSSQLFLDAYRRSQRLQIALDSRGLDGPLRVLPLNYSSDPRVWWIGAGLASSLLLAGGISG